MEWIHIFNFIAVIAGTIVALGVVSILVLSIVTFMAGRVTKTYDENGKEP